MQRDAVLKTLRAHEAELRHLGVKRLSLFGSVARGEETTASDVDLAAELDLRPPRSGFDYVTIADRLREMLGISVDLLCEPARRPRMQSEVDRDRVRVF
jgi:predicted nucleotidyltransferase